MNNNSIQLETYRNSLNKDQMSMFDQIRKLIFQTHTDVEETLFVKQPYFYLPEYESIKFHFRPSIMLSFFGHHVNIFALANAKYETKLPMYHFTEKHNLQIELGQRLEEEILKLIFKESLKPQGINI